jgi:hypothetical protein
MMGGDLVVVVDDVESGRASAVIAVGVSAGVLDVEIAVDVEPEGEGSGSESGDSDLDSMVVDHGCASVAENEHSGDVHGADFDGSVPHLSVAVVVVATAAADVAVGAAAVAYVAALLPSTVVAAVAAIAPPTSAAVPSPVVSAVVFPAQSSPCPIESAAPENSASTVVENVPDTGLALVLNSHAA